MTGRPRGGAVSLFARSGYEIERNETVSRVIRVGRDHASCAFVLSGSPFPPGITQKGEIVTQSCG